MNDEQIKAIKELHDIKTELSKTTKSSLLTVRTLLLKALDIVTKTPAPIDKVPLKTNSIKSINLELTDFDTNVKRIELGENLGQYMLGILLLMEQLKLLFTERGDLDIAEALGKH